MIGSGMKVVIADDSPTLRRIVASVLGRAGFEVVVATDGIEAVQAVFREQPDAVVLDVQMPRVSGYVAARLLKDDWQTAGIPVVLLTSLDAASDRYWGSQTGADRFLSKDFQAADLVGAVTEVIGVAARDLRADPVELAADDVLDRVGDLLDRKLFEASVAADVTALATTARGFEGTVAGLLGLLDRFVDYDLAAVLLLDERLAFVGASRAASPAQYAEFVTAAAATMAATSGIPVTAADLDARVADPRGLLARDSDEPAPERPLGTFLSMPLTGHGGRLVGVLALSAERPHAFGETTLTTLRIVAGPAAVVVENARLVGAHTG